MNTVPSVVNSKYLPSLDGLRALSIIVVILDHISRETPYAKYIHGPAGVNIFFVISGFLITTLLLKEKITTEDISLGNFYARRFLRIFPVAYLYLFLLIFLDIIFHLNISKISFVSAFLYLKNFIRGTDWQTTHFWSLAVEEQFYLLFPFILKFSIRLYTRLVIALIFFVPILNILYFHCPGFIQNTSLYPILKILTTFWDVWGSGTNSILWGSLCAIGLFKEVIPMRLLSKYKGFALCLLLILIFINNPQLFPFPGKEIVNMYLFPPGICIVLLMSIQPGKSLSFAFLNLPILRNIGILSYSLYIWQQLFTRYQPWSNTLPYGGSLWLNLIALGIVAYLSYYFFEKRFLLLKNRFQPKKSQTHLAHIAEKQDHSMAL